MLGGFVTEKNLKFVVNDLKKAIRNFSGKFWVKD